MAVAFENIANTASIAAICVTQNATNEFCVAFFLTWCATNDPVVAILAR